MLESNVEAREREKLWSTANGKMEYSCLKYVTDEETRDETHNSHVTALLRRSRTNGGESLGTRSEGRQFEIFDSHVTRYLRKVYPRGIIFGQERIPSVRLETAVSIKETGTTEIPGPLRISMCQNVDHKDHFCERGPSLPLENTNSFSSVRRFIATSST